jgi:NAD(P)-dependent dehydrogenase (short-subunit alcohol dehydrogenase family)
MKYDFSNHVVMITGAAGNLGTSVARAFEASGASLALVDRSPERLSRLTLRPGDSPDNYFTSAVDITDPRSTEGTVDEALRRFGKIDVLVNTAGGYRAGTPLHETPLSDWEFMLNLNARSVFVACQAVIPQMLRQSYGKIINIASRAALAGEAYHAAYSASKTAVVRLTESMAAELKDSGINVNCLLPGIIDTPPNREAMPDADYSKWVTTEEIADVILFLASEGARAVQGAAVPVYGRG